MASDTHPIIGFINESALGLPGSGKDIADFLLAEGTGVGELTMGQIATRTYTSKPSLVRFAQRAGYAGWRDFRRDFLLAMSDVEKARATQMNVDVNYPFAEGATADEIVTSLARIRRVAAEEVERSVDRDALMYAAHAILEARHVVFLGAMQNRDFGTAFANSLSTIGVLCHVPRPDTAANVTLSLTDGDCVIASSYSGNLSHGPMLFVPKLAERNVTTIAVTSSQRSALRESADYALVFEPIEHYHGKIGGFYSGACTTLILDMLYAACFSLRYSQSDSSRQSMVRGLEGVIPQSFDA